MSTTAAATGRRLRPDARQLSLFSVRVTDRKRFKPVAANERPQGVEYRDVPGFPGYQVGDDGSVWSQWKLGPTRRRGEEWRQLHFGYKPDGYCLVKLYSGIGRKRTRTVHQLVLQAFVGPIPSGQEVRHLDDNKKNNRLENLCYGTRSENLLDRHGKGWLRGEAHHQAKLTEAAVRVIRSARHAGISARQLGQQFGVSKVTIQRIARHLLWRHVA